MALKGRDSLRIELQRPDEDSGNGGDAVSVAGLDARLKENSLRFPQFLPDGNHFINFSRTLDPRNHAVYLDALDTLGKVPRRKPASAHGPSALG